MTRRVRATQPSREKRTLRSSATVTAVAAALALASGAVGAAPTPAAGTKGADSSRPSRTECLDAHHNAQELKRGGKLVEAREQLLVCSSGTCPGALITDCGNWMTEVEQMTPSVVLVVRLDGKETSSGKLFVDDRPVVDATHAVALDPGRHSIRAELPPFDPSEETIMMPEGQRMRLVSIEFHTPQPTTLVSTPPGAPTPALEASMSRPVPTLVYPLLGVGVAGLATFGVFAAVGKSKQSHLETQCEPHCTDADLSPMKTAYLVGDISAGVGVAAFLGAALLYATRPAIKESAPGPSLSFVTGPLGEGASARRSFGLSVSTVW
jgi:hypothetical protein